MDFSLIFDWLKHNILISILIVIVGFVLWLARFTNAIRDIISFIKSPFKPPEAPVRFTPEDLEREANPRFGFSFLYPKTWDRKDPTNSDGNTFVNPTCPRVKVLAWGAFTLNKTFDECVSETLKYTSQCPGYRLISNIESGKHLVSWGVEEGKVIENVEQIEGRKIQFEYIVDGVKWSVIEVLTEYNGVEYHARCEAPVKLFPIFEDLFLTLVASLRVIKQELKNQTS